jgi:hypothetical protein
MAFWLLEARRNRERTRTNAPRTGYFNRLVIVNRGRSRVFTGNDLYYRGKNVPVWTATRFSKKLGCKLYRCPHTRLWFRFDSRRNAYRPVWAAFPGWAFLDD